MKPHVHNSILPGRMRVRFTPKGPVHFAAVDAPTGNVAYKTKCGHWRLKSNSVVTTEPVSCKSCIRTRKKWPSE